jgi:hypothetical protein
MINAMCPLQVRNVSRWLERGILLLAVFYLFLHTIPRSWAKLNTDFPNYYLTARLAHEGYDTARIYEWTWLQREKDHRAVDDRVIGLIPITPFSTLVMWPLTALQPLTAKHVWILANLALLIPLCWMLRSITGLTWQRILLVFALSYPLHRNLLFGQFYLLLLALIVAACWAYLREHQVLAGSLVAIAAACKVFPLLFFVFFLQRRSWRALFSGVITGVATVVISVAVFGWNLHRTYLHEILPWTLHGEGMPPYVTSSASISSLLHYLFLAEPQWNPHPWHYSPLWYALLQPTLQMFIFAPALLFIRRDDHSPDRILLEWSALLTAALAISTMPASYHFVLMVFPVCVLATLLLRRQWYGWLGALLIVYLGIGFPMPAPSSTVGLSILLYKPRIFFMLALLLFTYVLLWRDYAAKSMSKRVLWTWSQYGWVAVMIAFTVISVVSTFHLQRAVRQEYAYRLPMQTQALLEASPQFTTGSIRYIALTLSGYHLVAQGQGETWIDPSSDDDLSFAQGSGPVWIERGLSPHSKIVDLRSPSQVAFDDTREPMLSADNKSFAFVRDDHGKGQLMTERGFQSDKAAVQALTPASLDVYEATFLSEPVYAFSAVEHGRPPQIYLNDATHSNAPLALGEARYPALSPDGHWMAYSHLEKGVWNLWVRNQETGATRRIANLPCNQIQPAWEEDSKTLLYSTDCGRSLWFTAIARRRVIP